MKRTYSKNGFTLIELIVVMGLFSMLIGLASVSLLTAQRQATLNSVLDTFIADYKHQQIKAMTGDNEGGPSSQSYGIFLESNSYTLFSGSSYDPNDTDNFEVVIPGNVVIQTFPMPNPIIFESISGEISGFDPTGNTIVFQTTTGSESQTITINELGVITP